MVISSLLARGYDKTTNVTGSAPICLNAQYCSTVQTLFTQTQEEDALWSESSRSIGHHSAARAGLHL